MFMVFQVTKSIPKFNMVIHTIRQPFCHLTSSSIADGYDRFIDRTDSELCCAALLCEAPRCTMACFGCLQDASEALLLNTINKTCICVSVCDQIGKDPDTKTITRQCKVRVYLYIDLGGWR